MFQKQEEQKAVSVVRLRTWVSLTWGSENMEFWSAVVRAGDLPSLIGRVNGGWVAGEVGDFRMLWKLTCGVGRAETQGPAKLVRDRKSRAPALFLKTVCCRQTEWHMKQGRHKCWASGEDVRLLRKRSRLKRSYLEEKLFRKEKVPVIYMVTLVIEALDIDLTKIIVWLYWEGVC